MRPLDKNNTELLNEKFNISILPQNKNIETCHRTINMSKQWTNDQGYHFLFKKTSWQYNVFKEILLYSIYEIFS